MNTLKLIAFCANGKSLGTIKLEDIPAEERDWNSWWYLHGELEKIVGYDKATTINCKSAGYSRETINAGEIHGSDVINLSPNLPCTMMYINGIVPVEIEGISEPCVGYFWTTNNRKISWQGKEYDFWDQRGLVCLKSDQKGCKYAEKKYKEKSKIL